MNRSDVNNKANFNVKLKKETPFPLQVSSGRFTMENLRDYLYGREKVQFIDTTKLQKERIKHLHINKEPKGNSCM